MSVCSPGRWAGRAHSHRAHSITQCPLTRAFSTQELDLEFGGSQGVTRKLRLGCEYISSKYDVENSSSHRSRVPSHRLPVEYGSTDLGDNPIQPSVRSRVRDRVLVDLRQLGFSLTTFTSPAGARESRKIRVLERVKGRAVQPPASDRDKLEWGEGKFRSGRVIETADESPSTFASREDVRLEIMASSDDGVPGGLNEGDERKSGHPNCTNRWSRPRIDDGDGADVGFGSTFKAARAKRDRMGLIVKARMSPDGEEEVVLPNPQRPSESAINDPKRELFTPECV